MCLLVLAVLFQAGVWQAAWSSARVSSDRVSSDMPGLGGSEGTLPPGNDADPTEGGRDERPVADDAFELAAVPIVLPRVKGAPSDGRADLAFDGLARGRPASGTLDKPPRG